MGSLIPTVKNLSFFKENMQPEKQKSLFCQNTIDKKTGETCGAQLDCGKCPRCDRKPPYTPYETLEDAILDAVDKSKEPLQSYEIADIIKETTTEKQKPSRIEMQVTLRKLEDRVYRQRDPRGSSKQYYWHKPFELPNLEDMAKPLMEQVHTLESYAEQRGISQKKAKEDLEKLISGKRAQKVTPSETEALYAKNKKMFLEYFVNENPGATCEELAKLAETNVPYASKRLRELITEGKVYAEKTPARRWLGPYKYYPSQAK